ncbi:GNAT family N-acetyltransferase [Calycomorphotria hydatis]|uniref:Ribosomal-protein-alanine N-acetyltransferase n=1 Tax=Calycomorphotria hydatis TaxID=2528027 RepID=A0A517T6A7_9PLAN|nr:GNAT family N-acetyltransferase [Calycomorphotria hydatis]QDT63915.1 ribosomal-protein-alanine N-acetyltransferase [Calycomorphotria hydatis]
MKYLRRYRMEIRCEPVSPRQWQLPDGYRWVPWELRWLHRHATVKYQSFQREIDRQLFTCFDSFRGCFQLMTDITSQSNFIPETTWLIERESSVDAIPPDCGTIQGMRSSRSLGAIQNVGVVPEVRGLGFGKALVYRSLDGFHQRGFKRVYLEVTAENHAAVSLYHSVGFRITRTMYKAAREDVYAESLS